jgi:hypothetical protein
MCAIDLDAIERAVLGRPIELGAIQWAAYELGIPHRRRRWRLPLPWCQLCCFTILHEGKYRMWATKRA